MGELKDHLRNKKIVILLVVIIALGTFLRIYRIEYQSLSNDELSSWKRSGYADLPTVINEGARTDVHPPGYYILLHFAQKVLGDSEWALRFPSALFGVLSILFIFLIGLRIYSYREALLAAALMAVLWCPLFYSQDVRMYSMLLFFALLSSYLWITMFETLKSGRPRRSPLIAYAVSAAICAHTHYFGTYLIALHGVFTILLFIRRRRALLAVLVVYISVAIVYIPWIFIMFEHLTGGSIWITEPAGGFVHSFSGYLKFISNDSSTVKNIAAAVFLLLFARTYGEFSVNPTRQNARRILSSPGAVLFLWLFVPFVGVYFKSILSTPVLSNRNLIISLPPACLLFSRSIMRIPVKSYIHAVTSCLAVVLLIYHLLIPSEYYTKITKDQFRDVVKYLLEDNRIDQCPVIVANTNQEGYFDYYFERLGSNRRVDACYVTDEDWPQVEEVITEKHASCLWYLRGGKREGNQISLLRKHGFELGKYEIYTLANVMQLNRNDRSSTASTRNVLSPHAVQLRTARSGGGAEPDSISTEELWKKAMEQSTTLEKVEIYRQIVDNFPEDKYAPQALFMIGFMYIEELNDKANARRALEELIERYPESSIIDSARWMIKSLDGPVPEFDIIIEEQE